MSENTSLRRPSVSLRSTDLDLNTSGCIQTLRGKDVFGCSSAILRAWIIQSASGDLVLVQLLQQSKLWDTSQIFTYLPRYKYSATAPLPFYPDSFIRGQTQVPKKQMRVLPLTALGSGFTLQQGKEKEGGKKKKKKTRGSKSIWRVASCPPPRCPQSAQPKQRQARGEGWFGHAPR